MFLFGLFSKRYIFLRVGYVISNIKDGLFYTIYKIVTNAFDRTV